MRHYTIIIVKYIRGGNVNEIVTGRCLWDFSIDGEAIVIDDELTTCVEECKDRIIVVHSPSPDFIIHMAVATAVVTETGGVLCHAAVLAMEIGCPIVVGAEDAIKLISNGLHLRVVGENGVGRVFKE